MNAQKNLEIVLKGEVAIAWAEVLRSIDSNLRSEPSTQDVPKRAIPDSRVLRRPAAA